MKKLIWLLVWTGNALISYAQIQAPAGHWQAQWIMPPGRDPDVYGVYHFRKSFELAEIPAQFIVHVSADQRYRLFLNGKPLGLGPARSDPQHWMYDTYDLAPHLYKGKNTLAAQVWNMGEHAPYAQMTVQTGFIVQGHSENEKIVNTNNSWKAFINKAYQPEINDIQKLRTYIVVGAGDRVDASKYPWGWEQTNFTDNPWPQAVKPWFNAKTRGFGTDGNWMLVPRSIPMMEESLLRMHSIRRASQNIKWNEGFLQGKASLTVPKNQKATLLIDQSHLTNAYPQLTVSKGRGASIKMSYAEGMMDADRQKGHRDSIEGRSVMGFDDVFIADGGPHRMFRPLWFRTYRYLQLDIETKGEALILEDLYGMFTGYPFEARGSFVSDHALFGKIWDIGWRTARLCAGETYFDCPYYEQLQYTGDTRIQALISLYVSGDDRLMRKAINEYNQSRIYEGLSQSRYPCNDMQIIPPFSLYWISMIYDYWMHRSDDAWVKSLLNGARDVLDWHEQRLGPDHMNGDLEWWNFVDWTWPSGTPPGREGSSSILSLQYVYTLQQAEKLFRNFGRNAEADHYLSLAKKIAGSTYSRCWDASRGLMADHPEKKSFSQHANIWALLTDAIPSEDRQKVFKTLLADTSINQATFYFKFYLFELLKKMEAGDLFPELLKPWEEMIGYGLTTFAEKPEPVRSDCHAWSASPNYQFLSIVAGINPSAPGFSEVQISPYLGNQLEVAGEIPHPKGPLKVNYRVSGQKLNARLDLPPGLGGKFIWKGIIYPLRPGMNSFQLDR
ncbi:MAG TPA: alpha-L-rhamnosidase N-terminal domain-containing protein [Saprospiraceae bacterium]|nr:alpha-L-rhamnosidase N-terminal domain-containing protein [Saprospiraceae bacterium]